MTSPYYNESWTSWLKERIPDFEIYIKASMILPILDKLEWFRFKSFLEYGFGSGYISIALANKGYPVQAYDLLPGLVEWANQSKRRYFSTSIGSLEFTSDKSQLKSADIVYSQGLLEHYDNEGIIALLNEQLAYANKGVMFSVPSINYKNQDYGDERLLDLFEWEKILAPFGDKLRELYYYDQKRHIIGVIKI
jgi:2-polyprenyl-3-methyl-5-hydroxy-6-metoxy-1,4-benzoquinol methylase